MSDEIELDAPQISTLDEKETPEPQSATNRTSKFRVKLLVGSGKGSSDSRKVTQVESEDEDDDDEDEEEDQLIDDDEDEVKPVAPPPPVTITVPSTSARAAPAGRGRGRGRGGGRRRGGKLGEYSFVHSASFVDPGPADGLAKGARGSPLVEGWTTASPAGSASAPPGGIVRKRGGGRGRGTVERGGVRKRATKLSKSAQAALLRDEGDNLSEAYAGTAASSPMPHDDHSPEPDTLPSAALPQLPPPEDVNLEGVPVPSYPLPSKPFPVQPPIKIATGFAPSIPLDKSGKTVRHWRQANREIRGIAGGRWFIRTWIGEKESEYATAHAAAVAAIQSAAHAAAEHALAAASGSGSVLIPKLSGVSISASGSGKTTPRVKVPKPDAGIGTANTSRAASSAPDTVSTQLIPKKRSNTGLGTPVVETSADATPQ